MNANLREYYTRSKRQFELATSFFDNHAATFSLDHVEMLHPHRAPDVEDPKDGYHDLRQSTFYKYYCIWGGCADEKIFHNAWLKWRMARFPQVNGEWPLVYRDVPVVYVDNYPVHYYY